MSEPEEHPWTQSVFVFNFEDEAAAIAFAKKIADRTGRRITVRGEDGTAIQTVQPILH